MSRRIISTKSSQQIKEEQINILLEEVEKNLDEYKKALELKDKQLSDAKNILQNAKVSYNKVIRENQELKKYIENIEVRYQQHQQQQQQKYIDKEREYFRERQPKRYKKDVYKEEPDSEPEVDENEYLSEEIEENVEKQKPKKKQQQKRKNNIFEYINNDAKKISDKVTLGDT